MRMVLNIVFGAAVVYCGLLVMMYLFQDRLLYFPTEQHIATPADAGLAYEDAWIPTRDDETIHAWWVPTENARGTVLFLHGNAGNISGRLTSVERFYRLGLNVLIVDYRGFGHSSGSPSEEGLYEDAAAAWRYATGERGVDPDNLVLFGRSLGAAPAAWLAAQEPVGALILESAFTSVPELAQDLYPIFPARYLARSSFDTLDLMPNIEAPVLIMHSRDDEIIPFEHGQRLYEAATGSKVFFELEGGHNEAHLTGGASYLDALNRFLTAHLGT